MKPPASSIELLENRIAPAGILNVTANAKGVSIAEDSANAGASNVSFAVQANGDLIIDPLDATQLRVNGAPALVAGAAFTVPGFAGGLAAKLGSGADQVALTGRFPGAVSLDLGTGADANAVTLTDASVGGAFTVIGGSGGDTVTFAGTAVNLFGPVKLTLGDGANVLANTATTLSTGGNFTATAGKGADDFLLGGTTVAILGKLDMNSGAGADDVGFDVAGLLQIGASVSLKSGGDPNGRTRQTMNGAIAVGIGAGVLMDVKAGSTDQHVISSGGPVVIGANAAFSSGVGFLNEVKVNAKAYLSITGNLTAKSKSTEAEVDIRSIDQPGQIGGAFSTKGFVSVIAEFSGSIAGAVKIDLPNERTNGYVFVGTKFVQPAPLWLGAVTITGKTDSNTIALSNTIVQGALKVTMGGGDDDFVLDDTILAAASKVDLGAGPNRFLIETGTFPTGTSQIFAPLVLKGGSDVDKFIFADASANAMLRVLAQITVIHGGGADIVTSNPNANFIVPLVELP